eukprot:TRINITY_DN406_c0_g3_i1.p1 TRINITY_DN406_c0_g3~~TRINITY_DN406_c0_g3_i1.p1  ORF type:complete len:277 (-),score=48.45 TRINITY_DN406_c0_g3_i1:46-876(-)
MIPIWGEGGILWGQVTVPAYTFKKGCEIHVSEGNTTSDKLAACGDTAVTPASVPFNLTLWNCDELSKTNFKHPLQLQIFAKEMDSIPCVGFIHHQDDQWSCTDNIHANKSDGVAVFTTEVYHFTTFAVLFSQSTGSCGWAWVQIASVVLLCVAFLASAVLYLLFVYSVRFRLLVGGKRAMSIRNAELRATRLIEKQGGNEGYQSQSRRKSLLNVVLGEEQNQDCSAVPTVVTLSSEAGTKAIWLDNFEKHPLSGSRIVRNPPASSSANGGSQPSGS